jgi:3-dehydroquinate synthase
MTLAATIRVDASGSPYDVIVGEGLISRVDELVRVSPHAERAVVVSTGTPFSLYAPRVANALLRLDLQVELVELPDGEKNKNYASLNQCLSAFANSGLVRDDLVVTVGGGMISDLAGFAAAIWNRGMATIHVPTTILAQVDAAIGGKTAIDLPEGKNLIGIFHQPIAVIADVETLQTLEERERRSGLAEILKYGFISDPWILSALENEPSRAVAGDPHFLYELVSRSIKIKAAYVASDTNEKSGRRSLLNYGHTVGHAIEAIGSYETFSHGESIAMGMVFAARLGERLGLSQHGLADRTVSALKGLGLPTGGIELDIDLVWSFMRRDKKARKGVRFVICPRPGEAQLIDQPSVDAINEVLRSLAV